MNIAHSPTHFFTFAVSMLVLSVFNLAQTLPSGMAQTPLDAEIDKRAIALESKMLTWRRDFHR